MQLFGEGRNRGGVLPISRVSSTVFLPGGWLANWFGVTVFQMVRPFCGNQLLWGRTVVEPWAETLTVANCISFAGMTQWGGFGKVAKLISVGNLGWAKLRQRKNLGIDSVLWNNLSHLLEDLYFLPEANPTSLFTSTSFLFSTSLVRDRWLKEANEKWKRYPFFQEQIECPQSCMYVYNNVIT